MRALCDRQRFSYKSFFYGAAEVKVASMSALQRVKCGVALTEKDMVFWTRIISLDKAKRAVGKGCVTYEEYVRIKSTTERLYACDGKSDMETRVLLKAVK